MAKLRDYSTTAASNNASPPNGWPEGMQPSDVNNCARENMARLREWYQDAGWLELDVGTRTSNTTFTVPGDQTANYQVTRRVRATMGSTVIYGQITAAAFTTLTTVTVLWDSTQLTTTLDRIELSILDTKQGAGLGTEIGQSTVTGNFTLTASQNGKLLRVNSASNVTITLPQQSTAALPVGFYCILRQVGAGQIILALEGTDTLLSPDSGFKSRTQGCDIFVDLDTAGTPNLWHADGALTT